jgi:hypothetical protein
MAAASAACATAGAATSLSPKHRKSVSGRANAARETVMM